MIVFYVDEAGCTGALPSATSPIQPVFALAGILIRQADIRSLTLNLINLKERFYPRRLPASREHLDWMNVEIKGADLRRDIRENDRDAKRHAFGFMDRFLDLLTQHNARILGKVQIKGIGQPFVGRSVYTSAVQGLTKDFQRFLTENNENGLLVLDSRHKQSNANVSHSVFTQKFRAAGDAYDRLLEMPLFGHSDNHAGIQCADLISSAFLFPIATYAYCFGHVQSVHVDIQYSAIRDRYGAALKKLQYRYQDDTGRWRGGITVNDQIGQKSGAFIFGPPHLQSTGKT